MVATLKLAGKTAPFTGADLLGISFAFGLIITALVYALGKVSGLPHQPCGDLALAVTKRMAWRDVPFYWASQFVGAVVGAFGIWAIFGQAGIDLGLGHAAFNPTPPRTPLPLSPSSSARRSSCSPSSASSTRAPRATARAS